MDVGVRELKQRLSEYLDRAERGEIIRVTDRGRPKATLGPLPGRLRLEGGHCRGLDNARGGRGARSGQARPPDARNRGCACRGQRGVSLYVDSSALLKRYVDESDSDACDAILRSAAALVTGRPTVVEGRRNLCPLVRPGDL